MSMSSRTALVAQHALPRTLKLAIECTEEPCRSFSLRTEAGDENDDTVDGMADDDGDDDFIDDEEVVGDLIL